MEPHEELRQLVDLAEQVGLRVRRIRGSASGDGEPAAASAVCRVRGEPWIVLSGADPVEGQIAVVAGAIRRHAGPALEGRYLPPALRERLEGSGPGGPGPDPGRA